MIPVTMERYHIFKLGLAITFYTAYCIQPMIVVGQKVDDVNGSISNQHGSSDDDYFVYYQGVEGTPGIDFPILSHIPRTSFSCQNMESGYYADLETDCQVFHICEEGKKISFLCPNGTQFQQADLICEWWFKVNCTDAPNLYVESVEQLREYEVRAKASRRVTSGPGDVNHGAVMRLEEHSSVSAIQNGKKYKVPNANTLDRPKNTRHEKSLTDSLGTHGINDNADDNTDNTYPGRNINYVRDSPRHTVKPFADREINTPQRAIKKRVNNAQSNTNAAPDLPTYNTESLKGNTNQDRNNRSNRRRQRTTTTIPYKAEPTTTTQAPHYQKDSYSRNTEKDRLYQRGEAENNYNNFNQNGQYSKLQTNQRDFTFPTSTRVSVQDIVTPENKYDNQDRNIFGYTTSRVSSVSTNTGSKHAKNLDDYDNSNSVTNSNKGTKPRQETFQNSLSVTKKDIISSKLEADDSDESQITQESASFFKNSANSLNEDNKKARNPYPNHRQSYSKPIDPKSYTERFTTISSVTPDYVTTQPINSGKPFVGSRVGTPLKPRPFTPSASGISTIPYGPTKNNNIVRPTTERSTARFNHQSQFSVSFDSTGEGSISAATERNLNTITPVDSNIFSYNRHNINLGKNGPNGLQNDQRYSAETNAPSDAYSYTTRQPFSDKFTFTTPYAIERFNTGDTSTRLPPVNERTSATLPNQSTNIFNAGERKDSIPFTTTTPLPGRGPEVIPTVGSLNRGPLEVKALSKTTGYLSTTGSLTRNYPDKSVEGQKSHLPTSAFTRQNLDPNPNAFTGNYQVSPQSEQAREKDIDNRFDKNSYSSQNYKTFQHRNDVSPDKFSTFNTGLNKTSVGSGRNSFTAKTYFPTTGAFPTVSVPTGLPLLRRGSAVVPTVGSFNIGQTQNQFSNIQSKKPIESSTLNYNNFSLNPVDLQVADCGGKAHPSVILHPTSTSVSSTASHKQSKFESSLNVDSTPYSGFSTLSPDTSTGPTQGTFNTGKTTNLITGQGVDNGDQYVFLHVSHPSRTTTYAKNTNQFNTEVKTTTPATTVFSVESAIRNRLISELEKGKEDFSGQRYQANNVISVSPTLPPFDSTTHIFARGTEDVPKAGSFNNGKSTVKVGPTTVRPEFQSTTIKTVDHATVWGTFSKEQATEKPTKYNKGSFVQSTIPNSVSATTVRSVTNNAGRSSFSGSPYTYLPTTSRQGQISSTTKVNDILSNAESKRPFSANGFFVTRDPTMVTSTKLPHVKNTYVNQEAPAKFSTILKPRPFELADLPGLSLSTRSPTSPPPTQPTYAISSAAPFTTSAPPLSTTITSYEISDLVYENVDNMLMALMKVSSEKNEDYSSETPRPGLIIPPSAGPQTLHTLAAYFANALDGIGAEKDENGRLKMDKQEKERLTALLTKMTMDRYNELFGEIEPDTSTEDINTSTTNETVSKEQNDLEGQHSKNPVQTPQVRQLAKMFTQALSAYLDDPDGFKRSLEEVRPTEPPSLDVEDTTSPDDELLNFSDADAKSSYPQSFPTVPSVSPTWGYILALNNNNSKLNTNLGGQNSLSGDENLQHADSQSFVSQFNSLKSEDKQRVKYESNYTFTSSSLPPNHWTTSPDVTKLWRSTLSVNPVDINYSIPTTEQPIAVTEEATEETLLDETFSPIEPHNEVNYELHSLSNLALNSSKVQGILIDFMNNSKTEENNKLQRILRKLNTTEDEFLTKMKEINSNPLTRRLILLLISECGQNVTKDIETRAVQIDSAESDTDETLKFASSNSAVSSNNSKNSNDFKILVDSTLDNEDGDTRALQLLNSLYSIASKFGK